MSADHATTFAGIGDEAGRSIGEQVEAHRRLGWSTIELRNVDGVALADLDDGAFGRVVEALGHAGLGVVCVDSRIANWARPITGDFGLDLDELDRLGKRCAALGTRYVRVMSYPNDGLDDAEWGSRVRRRMGVLAERAEALGLVLLHENCAGWAGADAGRALRLVEEVDSPALRLLFDIGNGVAYGYEAHDMLVPLLPWVEHVHVKDARGENGEAVYTLPGDGVCRVADCVRLLLDAGYTGAWTMEPHLRVRPHEGRTDAGADGLAEFVEYGRAMERLVAAVRGTPC
ncbi:sugar phosphate isomerase/epimerase family protein [Umezawaea sp. Da 62-37]|uniref:sugar phosphate isomerase/epimerase family protein n=1 Tax=Umezawaea sp. Da 62-37 TaxID=3075927 RepID=UPI0028F6C0EE|nr:sugar phosphate isomerase/epimerase family protein [Umezawaea sp. Da 62-37]WNV88987.1 sugar phosphate isomerase/epimerase family protein [Umezawaea sp. Da 62-37]